MEGVQKRNVWDHFHVTKRGREGMQERGVWDHIYYGKEGRKGGGCRSGKFGTIISM